MPSGVVQQVLSLSLRRQMHRDLVVYKRDAESLRNADRESRDADEQARQKAERDLM